jgi:translation initiation factor 3 subunit D
MSLSEYIPGPSDTWGPSKIDHSHTFIPVEFVGRTEKLGRFCDFTSSSTRVRRGDEAEDFKFVDTRRDGMRQKKFAPKSYQYQQGGRGGRQQGRFARGGRGQWGAVRIDHRTGKPVPLRQGSAAAQKQQPWRSGYNQRYGGMGSTIVKGIREWSTPIKPDYFLLSEINMSTIGRKKIDASKSEWFVTDANKIEYEDLLKCGRIATYDKTYDKIPARQPKPLTKSDNVNFYNVTTGQDPVMEELITRAVQATETSSSSFLVACTDQVLATLMAANRSQYSWDLIVTRNGNTILIDKRDSSPIDFLSVNENSQDQPSFDEAQDPLTQINSPIKLGIESTGIVQNFSQQVLAPQECEDLEYPNPFHDEEDQTASPACVGYTYRKAFIPSENNTSKKEWNFIIRGEIDGKLATPNGEEYVSIKALNEFDFKSTQWRESFEKSRDAAVFATEMKNNSCKIAKWLACATVSGCDVLKLGFVSRKVEDDPWNHSVLAVQTHTVKDLMSQMSLSVQSMWSSVCSVLDAIINSEEQQEEAGEQQPIVGKYLLVKDPSKPSIGIYAIPWSEFEEEEDDEEFDEDGEEEDEEEATEEGQGY